MNKEELFSVIVLHYNQPGYVFNALNSVFSQNYEHIELIFADDASRDIDLEGIKDYISKNKGENIESVSYVINDENLGTVKTINRAVKSANGGHLLFFAADDALYDENVVSNFVKAFKKADDDVYMISAQCHMMNESMDEEIEIFVHQTLAMSFNKMTAYDQFRVFSSSCFLAIGATAMRVDMFEKFGYFNETYKYIEDWSYFLYLTRSGGLIRYGYFDALLHRNGGISHYLTEDTLPPHILQYKMDILNICRYEIFPYFKDFSFREKLKVFHRYQDEKESYYEGGGTEKTLSNLQLLRILPKFYLHLAIGPFLKTWDVLMRTIMTSVKISVIFLALTFCKTVFNIPVISDVLVKVFGVALYVSVGINVLVLLLSIVLKLLSRIKKLLKGD